MKLACISTSIIMFAFVSGASAVSGVLDYNTYMYEDYYGSACEDHWVEQWVNYDDWKDEMDDIATCSVCKKNDTGLWYRWVGNGRSYGIDADLVAVDTHGGEWGTGPNHDGWMMDRYCSPVYLDDVDPISNDPEIWLFNVCHIYSRQNYDNWFTFRNLHRKGSPVSAGCWDTCYITDMVSNTTWNEMGDEIADTHSTIYVGWRNAHNIDWFDDDIIIIGLGSYPYGDCAIRAETTSFQNRLSKRWNSEYMKDHPWPTLPGHPELCGYYWSNL